LTLKEQGVCLRNSKTFILILSIITFEKEDVLSLLKESKEAAYNKLKFALGFITISNTKFISLKHLQRAWFPDKEKGLNLLYTHATEELYQYLVKHNYHVYISSPVGYGKTWSLILAILRIKQENPGARIVYINNPVTILKVPIQNYFKELLFMFYSDDFPFPNGEKCVGPENDPTWKIVECLAWWVHDKEGVMRLTTILTNAFREKIFHVVDQSNVFDRPKNESNNGKIIFDYINSKIQHVIICTSYNNENIKIDKPIYKPYEFSSQFSRDEAKSFLISNIHCIQYYVNK